MITINELLDDVLMDFKDYVGSQSQLCNLWDVHFDSGRIPDYSNVHSQQLYLLRYAYAYAFEYKRMYKALLQKMNLGNMIEVTSIGCGNLLDYWSLAHVVGQNCDIYYHGLDNIDWSYVITPRSNDNVRRDIGDAISFFQKTSKFTSDIYIFPKSISEFSPTNVLSLANCFTKESMTKDVIHFMFSLRTDSGSIARDMRNTKIIYDRLLACGFKTSDSVNSTSLLPDEIQGRSIRELDRDFLHPDDVVDYLKTLYEECIDYFICPKKTSCEKRLGRWPILKCKQAAWQIFTFER